MVAAMLEMLVAVIDHGDLLLGLGAVFGRVLAERFEPVLAFLVMDRRLGISCVRRAYAIELAGVARCGRPLFRLVDIGGVVVRRRFVELGVGLLRRLGVEFERLDDELAGIVERLRRILR